MTFVTTGLTNGGVTTHYRFSYDQALAGSGGPEPGRTNAVIAACEGDYALMAGWFGNSLTVTGMDVQVTTQSHGASWSGTSTASTIQLNAQGSSYSNNAAYLRYLLIAEVTEIFMMTQNRGWFQGGDEGSKGEGLSRFLSGQFLAQNNFLGLGIDADYAVADLWLNSPRLDYVNNDPDDHGYNAINGCTTLFIYYMFHQLGYSVGQIVAAAGPTLAAAYTNLTGDPRDPFPLFKQMLDARFPSQTGSAVPGPNFDDPWPLGDVAWAGVWRSGDRPYYLWMNASQSDFVSKWQTLASQNMRLTDIDVSTVNGRQLWSGIWEDGTDGYYLWYDANQAGFLSKWSELAAQNFRLVSISNYNGRYAGAWRTGTDGYYLWVDANDASFIAKFNELAAQNLRLVDFDVSTDSGERRWSGVWRSGSDGYYLWINANWESFSAKWSELAAQGLRLVGIQHYDGLWAGIWRSGSDAYYLWVNSNESSFLAKWGALQAQNLRLVDVIAAPFGGATGSDSAAAAETAVDAPVATRELDLVGSGAMARGPGAATGAGGGSTSGPTTEGIGLGGGGAGQHTAGVGDASMAGFGAGGGSGDSADHVQLRASGSGAGGGSVPTDDAVPERPSSVGHGGGSDSIARAVSPSASANGSGNGGGPPAPDASAETSGVSEERGDMPGHGVHLKGDT